MEFVELPVSGITIDLEDVSWVARMDLNKFVVMFKRPQANSPMLDGVDCDLLKAALKARKLVAPSPIEVGKA